MAPQNTLDTRQRLLHASLKAFGHRDYDAVSTRDIVKAAGANISAISYHFGGKHGLYLETAAYLAENLSQGMQSHFQHIYATLKYADNRQCRALLQGFIRRFAENLLVGEFGEDAPGFIFREQNHPTEAFDILYEKLFDPMHNIVGNLIACIRGLDAEYPETKLVAHALIGQVISFRAGRTTVMRRLGIHHYTDNDARLIGDLLAALTDSAIDYNLSASGAK